MKTFNNVWLVLSACVCLGSVFCQYGPSLNSYPSHFLSYDYYGTPTYTGYIPRVALEQDFNRIGESIPAAGFDQTGRKFADENDESPAPFKGFASDGQEQFPFHGFKNDNPEIQSVGIAGVDNLDVISNPNRFHPQHMPVSTTYTKSEYPNYYNPYYLTPSPPLTGIIPTNESPDIPKTYHARQDIKVPRQSETEHKNPYQKPFEQDKIPFPTDFSKNNPHGEYQNIPNQMYVPLFQKNLHLYDWNKLLNKFGQPINANNDDRSLDSISQTAEHSTKKNSVRHEENTNKPTELPTELPTKLPTEMPTKLPTILPSELPTEQPTEPPSEPPSESTKLPHNQQHSSVIPSNREDFSNYPMEDNLYKKSKNTDKSFSDKYKSKEFLSLNEYETNIKSTEKIWTKNQDPEQKNLNKEKLANSLDVEPKTSAGKIKPSSKPKNKDLKRTIKPLAVTPAIPKKMDDQEGINNDSNGTTTAEWDEEKTMVFPDDDDEISRKYIAPIPNKIPTMNELINEKNKTNKNSHSYDIVKALRADESTEAFPNNMKYIYDDNQNTSTEPQLTIKPTKVETTTIHYTFKTNEKRHDLQPTSPYGNHNTIDSFDKKAETHIGSPYIHQRSLKDQKYNVFKNKENGVDVDDSVDDINSGMLNSGPEDDHIETDAEPRDCLGTEKRETKIEVTFNRPVKVTSAKVPCLQPKPLDTFIKTTVVTIEATSTPQTTETIVESSILDNVDDSCQTTYGENGTCMILYSCKPLLVKVARATEDDVKFLRQAHCGFDGTIPKVCCPNTPASSTLRPSPVTKRSLPKDMNFVDLFPKPPDCGVGGTIQGPAGRIVGGLPAKLGSFPWMALLGYKTRAGTPDWKCGGSLITNSHVLTAAHCILNQEKSLYTVRLGELDTARDDDGATPLDVFIHQMIAHKEYDQRHLTNDIGIVVLKWKVEFTSLIRPICLPLDEQLRKKTFEKYMPVVAGWGNTGYLLPESTYLRAVQLPVVTNKFCNEVYSRTPHRTNVIDERVICAGFSKGKDSCQGDSGGPLMQPIWNSNSLVSYFYQIGIVSYGKKCGVGGVPGVYTRVTTFLPWIQETVAGTLNL